MKIKCKCGRILVLSMDKHAGKKVACKECGQRYRLPPSKPAAAAPGTVQMKAWKDEDKSEREQQEHEPDEVGVQPMGEKVSFGWILTSVMITLGLVVGGSYGMKLGLPKLMSNPDVAQAQAYIKLALYWLPPLVFVLAGWITARFSPGKTITEPALGAALSVAVLVALVIFQPGPIKALLTDIIPAMPDLPVAQMANSFALAMFTAAMLACSGAYFGEVAQERSRV